jgi:hypothetical protein
MFLVPLVCTEIYMLVPVTGVHLVEIEQALQNRWPVMK